MFDCPLATQTSPTSTFFISIRFFPLTVSGKGPPGSSGLRETIHLPPLAVAETFCP
jgi:hypothetical protein